MDPVNNPTVDPLTSPMPHNENPMDKQFAPKQPVQLDKPNLDNLISQEELAAADGTNPDKPTYVAIKGVVFDVSRNKAYQPGGSYSGMDIHLSYNSLLPKYLGISRCITT